MDKKKSKEENKIITFLNILIHKDNKPKWNYFFMAQACLASLRSNCERLHVGCVIVKDNRVISTGYNGFLKGAPHVSRVRQGHEQFTIHAEQNAICDAAYRGVSIKDSIIYITHYPCLHCFKMLIASGAKEIIFLENYKNDELIKEMAIENSIKLIQLI